MRKKIHSQLWIYFACLIFLLLLIVFFIFISLMLLLGVLGLIVTQKESHVFPLLFILLISLLIGLCISGFTSHRILQPIDHLRKAMSAVAKGDFSIQLAEEQRIDEVQQLYHDFNKMVKDLSSIETLRNDFVSNISHEFKTPIATIQGYIQLLQSPDLDSQEQQLYLQRIAKSSQQLSQLTENILKLTKLETQEIALERKSFSLDEQLRQVILLLQPKWEKNDLQLELELPSLIYNGNEELLYQVWLNVLDNAIKYSRPGGLLAVRLAQENQQLVITIKDSGIGMDEQQRQHMFDKFYQGDTSRKTKGNGLGLALVKQIIDLHGGTIEVLSEPKIGTTFTIYLPITEKIQIKLKKGIHLFTIS